MRRSKLHSDPKTDAELFKQCLYGDPDFKYFSTKFNQWTAKDLTEKDVIVLELLSSKKQPLKNILIEKMGHCEGVNLIEEAAYKFEIPERVIEYGFIKRPDVRGVTEDRKPKIITDHNAVITIADDELAIKLNSNTRLEDIEDIWSVVETFQKALKGYVKKLEGSYNYKLVYAIYKQRLRNEDGKRTKFEDIFNMYKTRKLPAYEGSTDIAYSETLERLYRRHMPKPDSL